MSVYVVEYDAGDGIRAARVEGRNAADAAVRLIRDVEAEGGTVDWAHAARAYPVNP